MIYLCDYLPELSRDFPAEISGPWSRLSTPRSFVASSELSLTHHCFRSEDPPGELVLGLLSFSLWPVSVKVFEESTDFITLQWDQDTSLSFENFMSTMKNYRIIDIADLRNKIEFPSWWMISHILPIIYFEEIQLYSICNFVFCNTTMKQKFTEIARFSTKITVSLTRSLTLVPYEWVSLVEYVSQSLWVTTNYKVPFSYVSKVKPWPWAIKGENVNFLPSLSLAANSFTPFIGVYIAL